MGRDKNKEKVEYLKTLENGWLHQVFDVIVEKRNNLEHANTQELWMTIGKIKAAKLVLGT